MYNIIVQNWIKLAQSIGSLGRGTRINSRKRQLCENLLFLQDKCDQWLNKYYIYMYYLVLLCPVLLVPPEVGLIIIPVIIITYTPINQSINQSIIQSINQLLNESLNHSINLSLSYSINQLTSQINEESNQSINQPNYQSINESICQSINRWIHLTSSLTN